jgi:hypothetical protein
MNRLTPVQTAKHFLVAVLDAHGVVLKVPINELGEENSEEAEMRLHLGGEKVPNPEGLPLVFAGSVDLGGVPLVEEGDITDQSTWGFFGWRGYRGGWARPYRYFNYRPTFFRYGRSYSFYPTFYYTGAASRYYYYCY